MIGEIGNGEYLDRGVFSYRGGGGGEGRNRSRKTVEN